MGDEKRVLVLGGSGFIGSQLQRQVSQAPENSRLRLFCPSSAQLPLGNLDALSKALGTYQPSTIINLAAISDTQRTKEELAALNAASVKQILDSLAAEGYRGRFIQASSAFVYGPKAKKCSESMTVDPFSAYAETKIQAETYCRQARPLIDTTIIRFFSCIGAGQRQGFVFPKLIDTFKNNRASLNLGSDSQKDWIDVRDIARWLADLAGRSEDLPEIINFSSGTPRHISDIVELMKTITGHSPTIKWNQPEFIRNNDILCQFGCTEIRKSLGLEQRYLLEDSIKWILTE